MRTFKKIVKSIPDLTNKTYIITGANSGLGYALSELLVMKNATVIMANRSQSRTEDAITKLRTKYPHAVIKAYYFDQSSPSSIKALGALLVENHVTFDGIVFNAGLYLPPRGAKTEKGISLTFGVNYYGNYLLVKTLAQNGLLNHKTRLVFTSSLAAKKKFSEKTLNDLISGENITRHQAYRGAKTAINILALGLMVEQTKFPFTVTAKTYVYHPGITSSNITRFKFKPFNTFVHFFMRVVFHRPQKAVLGALVALTTPNDLAGKMIVPAIYKEWRGLPIYKKMDKQLLDQLTLLISKSEQL